MTPGAPMIPATVHRKIDVSTVSMSAGEYITVFLLSAATGPVQVECRVDLDGTPRVLVKREHLGCVSAFEEVYG